MTTISNSNFNYDNVEPNSNKPETQGVKKEDSTSIFSVYDFNKDSKVSVSEQKQVMHNILSPLIKQFEKYGVLESDYIDSTGLSDITTDGSKESANAANDTVNQKIEYAKSLLINDVSPQVDADLRKSVNNELNKLRGLSIRYKNDIGVKTPEDKENLSNTLKTTVHILEVFNKANPNDNIKASLEKFYSDFPEFVPKDETEK